MLLSSATASFDLAVTSGNQVLTSGIIPQSSDGGATPYTFGLFQPGLSSNAISSLLTFPTSNAGDFGESIAYLPGTTEFTANSGAAGGQVAIVLSDLSGAATGTPGNNFVEILRPVPEPATAILLALQAWHCCRITLVGVARAREPFPPRAPHSAASGQTTTSLSSRT